MSISLPLSIYQRISAGITRTNAIDVHGWEDEVLSTKDVHSFDRGPAPPAALHLQQVYVEFEEVLGNMNDHEEFMASPYQTGICIVRELIYLLISDELSGGSRMEWLIAKNGRIYEYCPTEHNADTNTAGLVKERARLTLVHSK